MEIFLARMCFHGTFGYYELLAQNVVTERSYRFGVQPVCTHEALALDGLLA